VSWCSQHRANARHLAVVRSRINCDIAGLCKGGEAGQAKEDQAYKPHFAQGIRVDAYCNHINWNYYKHGLCHHPARKVRLENPLNPADSLPRQPVKSTPSRYDSVVRLGAWLIFACVVVAVVWARIRLAGLPLERDEGEYAYTGQLILRGIAPYELAYSMKLPGTSAAYALLMSILGETPNGIHIGLIAINFITVAMVFLLGRELLGEIGGVAAGAAYAVLSLMPHVLGQAAHATHFVVLCATAGALVLLRSVDRESQKLLFTGGCLFGLAILMKQPGALFAFFGLLFLAGSDWRARAGLPKILHRSLVFIGGVILPCAIAALALWAGGVFGKFWFWTIQYAAHYGTRVSLDEAIQLFSGHFFGVIGTAWPIWAIASFGLVLVAVRRPALPHAGFLLAFTFFAALAVCPGFYFRPHYFILFLPAVSILAGAAVTSLLQVLKRRATRFSPVVLLLFAFCVVWPLWSESDFFFERPLPEANRMVNGTNPFPESVKIGEYIRDHSDSADTIAVLGSEPQIYFYSRRQSATGYIYTYALMEPQPYAQQMQREMIREVETARPKFLVLVVINTSWLVGPESDQAIFRWADRYCDTDYEQIGLINITDSGTDYFLSGRPANITPAADHILLYRRKT